MATQELGLSPPEALELISKGVAEGITIQDATGRVVYANEAAARLAGYSSADAFLRAPLQEILDRFDILDASGRPLDLSRLPGRRALQGEEEPEIVVLVREAATGRKFWRTASARPVFDRRGNVRYAVNVFRDVTPLKEIEERLRARADQQRAVAELGQRALGGLDLSSLMDEASGKIAATLGVEFASVLELQPDDGGLLLRAGVGWREGQVGSLVVPGGRESLSGFTLLSREPVIVEDLREESRFTVPAC